mgnify:CR=1 FL=1
MISKTVAIISDTIMSGCLCANVLPPIPRPSPSQPPAQLLFSFDPLLKVPLSLRKANPITFNGVSFRTNVMRKSAKKFFM